MSLDHRVGAVFLFMTHLMQYVVDGGKAFGLASLRRTNYLVERFRVVAQGVRTFHAQNTQVALSGQSKGRHFSKQYWHPDVSC